MSATAVADRPRLRRPAIESPWTMRILGGLALLLLVAISVWERTRVLNGSFWMDEGLSVGIASHPFSSIPHLLRQDGSPPLYYLMLHVWMRWFGTTEATTHTLSLLAALGTIPAGLWAGRALFSPRAGWICAALCTLNPFLTVFGQETRMYAMLTLECMLATALLALVFVHRRRRLMPVLVAVLATALYTHGWAIFFFAGAVVGWLVLARRAPEGGRRELVVDGLIVFGAAGVLFLPWVPTLLEQSAHTAAPWSTAPRFGAPIQISRGLLGGDAPSVALLLAGGAGLVATLRQAKGSPQRRIVAFMVIVVFATLACAWILSQITPAWTTRYFGVVLGPILLLLSHGLAKMRGVGLVALLAVAFFWWNPKNFTGHPKSDLRDIATVVIPQMKAGDLVINAQPEQTPATAYYLGPDMRYASPLSDRVDPDPYLMNWYDALSKFRTTNGQQAATRLVASLKPGQKVLMVRPITDGVDNWKAPWTGYIRRRAAQFSGILGADKSLKRVAVAPLFYRNATEVGNSAVLYEKTSEDR